MVKALDNQEFMRVCLRGLDWARERDYTGFSKHDGLNSSLLRALSFDRKWLRILFIQGVMRSPFNVRPLLGVRPAVNPKGIALFARAWLNLFHVTGDSGYRDEARRLLDWLLELPSSAGFNGLSWGYPYPWQDLGFYAPPGFPNRIVTYFAGRALVHGFEALGERRYLEAAEQAVEFILTEPVVLHDSADHKCLSYVPVPGMTMAILDIPALCGVLCAAVGHYANRPGFLSEAQKLLAWTVDKQTSEGAWYYTHPPDDSHITHDNYHTGEIVDALLEYERFSGDTRFRDAYYRGLDFYRARLFTVDHRPKWMYDKVFPHDAHGYSQGILTFSLAGELDRARSIAAAAIEDLWNERDGRFGYQQHRRHKRGYTLMRWSQGWLCHSLASFLAAKADQRAP